MSVCETVVASITYRSGDVEIGSMRVNLYDATSENYENVAMEFAESNPSLIKRSTRIDFRFTGGVDSHLMWVL